MKISLKNIFRVSTLLWLISLSPCGASQTLDQRHTLNGTWFLSVPDSEGYGFVEGYFDCYFHEYKGPDNYSYSDDVYAAMLSDRYYHSPTDDKQSVVDEIHEIRDNPGMSFGDLHSNDKRGPAGLKWMQMDAVSGSNEEPVRVEQRGYIEGYLACHTELNHDKGGVFSSSPNAYVTDIDHWYRYIRSTADSNAVRQDTPIRKVLFMFADKPAASKPNRN